MAIKHVHKRSRAIKGVGSLLVQRAEELIPPGNHPPECFDPFGVSFDQIVEMVEAIRNAFIKCEFAGSGHSSMQCLRP
jgi:hypothetical protein